MAGGTGQPGKGHTVLAVDDEAIIRKVVDVGLRGAGFEVSLARDGREALTMLDHMRPDIIVSDVNMPGLDGIGLLRAVRENPDLRGIPVILLTARGEGDLLVDGFQQGADDYVSKPFKIDELVARVLSKLDRPPTPAELVARDLGTGLLTDSAFTTEVEREYLRFTNGGSPAVVARMTIHEGEALRQRLGRGARDQVLRAVAENAAELSRPLDVVGLSPEGGISMLLPETSSDEAQRALRILARQLTVLDLAAGPDIVRITPNFGHAAFTASPLARIKHRVDRALDRAEEHLDIEPVAWTPGLEPVAHAKASVFASSAVVRTFLDLPGQLASIIFFGMIVPFCVYLGCYRLGFDISAVVYGLVVASLLGTAVLIWIEGFLAMSPRDPPPFSGEYPKVAALIAAYLPNEAATILETARSFLEVQYPGPYEVLLAYNTPEDLPVEEALAELSAADPRLRLVKVPNSTSKAQNVNYALDRTSAVMIGIFDADHHPEPHTFTRAWHWLASGVDVVQGHCLVRNGEENRLTRTIAVEFELMYGVAHPGRARMHGFGIFGGSNGFWSTDLLRRTRMQGSMLTEDIDSSLRLLADGGRIVSDPFIVSHELAPATPKAWWNQRTRWSQGWFEVSLRHSSKLIFSRSRSLSLQNRLGIFHLTVWREIYPWLSFQIYPLIAFFCVRKDGPQNLHWFVPIFVLTTIFTMGTGPVQAIVAYLLAHPQIRRHGRWFLFYAIVSTLFYSQLKEVLGMVSQLRHFRGDTAWRITPRSVTAPLQTIPAHATPHALPAVAPSSPVPPSPVSSPPVSSPPVSSPPVSSPPVSSSPIPSSAIPSAPVPASDVPSAPVPSAPVPSAPVPSAPVPASAVPSAPIPSAPVPASAVPSAPVPSAPVPSAPVPASDVPSAPIPSAPVPASDVLSAPAPSVPLRPMPARSSPTRSSPTHPPATPLARTAAPPPRTSRPATAGAAKVPAQRRPKASQGYRVPRVVAEAAAALTDQRQDR